MYERSREHVADMQQLKPSSHLLKHIVDKHENENPAEIEFGIKVIKFTRSSFERQILESVVIQQERHHHLLNSKAEYNRSAVPRLASKMGENQFKKWEKKEEAEKEKNEELENRIRAMRKSRNKERRQQDRQGQPAEKRRRVEAGEQVMRRTWGRPAGQDIGMKRVSQYEKMLEPKSKKMRLGDIEKDEQSEQEACIDRYAEFGECDKFEIYDWDKKMAEYRREIEKEEMEKNLRVEKARKMEKSWELLRMCRDFMRENAREWSEQRDLEEKRKGEEERKTDRLEKCNREKEKLQKKIIEEKISAALSSLPREERERYIAEEEKEKRIEMKNIKENIWKKWRNRREENRQKSGEERDFEKADKSHRLEKLEKIIQRLKSEELEREEMRERNRERKRAWRKEKEKEESKMLVRELERAERREKKKQIEDRWALMKWVTKYIDENEANWRNE